MEAIIGVTYRCNYRCLRCNIWKYPSPEEDEISLDVIRKLPHLKFANITGGEPFLRSDINEIGKIVADKTDRATIVTTGFFRRKAVAFSKANPGIGIRISLEGLPKASDKLRGIPGGFDRSMRTLLELADTGLKDLGFSITLSDENYKDLMVLYNLAEKMNLEFATAVVHNSYYFHKTDNFFEHKDDIAGEFKNLMKAFLRTRRVKNWFRAWFVGGIINKIYDRERLLPCSAAQNMFYLDPFGEIRPCNVKEVSLGNLKEKSFEEIWNGPQAEEVRRQVKSCKQNCWMIGSVTDPMKRNIRIPAKWIIKNKWNLIRGKDIELPCVQ